METTVRDDLEYGMDATIKDLLESLQRSNRTSLNLLRLLELRPSDKGLATHLTAAATVMRMTVQVLATLQKSASTDQTVKRIELLFTDYESDLSSWTSDPDALSISEPDSVHYTEVERLLQLAFRLMNGVVISPRWSGSLNSRVGLTALKRVISATLQQQELINSLAVAKTPEIVVLDQSSSEPSA